MRRDSSICLGSTHLLDGRARAQRASVSYNLPAAVIADVMKAR